MTYRTAKRRALGAAVAVVTIVVTAVSPAAAAQRWSVVPSPNVAGAHNQLVGISCTSESQCVAAGTYSSPGQRPATLIEHWDGARWTIVPSPNQSGADAELLAGVACATAASCFVVGEFTSQPTFLPNALIEHWDGQRWTIDRAATPAGAIATNLGDVECTKVDRCLAVGDWLDSAGFSHSLVERWDGLSWHVEATPDSFPPLVDVTCPRDDDCFAVAGSGTSASPVLIERWDGSTWRPLATPDVGNADLVGIACTDQNLCFAVGDIRRGPSQEHSPLVERWDGHRWSVVPSPPLSGSLFSQLTGVACRPNGHCVAVGYSTDVSSTTAVIVPLHGRQQVTLEPGPVPPDAPYTLLFDASCEPKHTCVAVGEQGTPTGQGATLVERSGG